MDTVSRTGAVNKIVSKETPYTKVSKAFKEIQYMWMKGWVLAWIND